MRGDGTWNAGICKAVKMCSIQGLPAEGSDTSIFITRVHLHPLCELVEFWAKFNQEEEAHYVSLAQEIQSPGTIFREFDGNPGDQCLAQKDGIWHRARIVSQNGSQYIVFLIDKGLTYSTVTTMLAWGKKEYFYLPPEVEFCVLANVLPVSPENRWSPVALEFLKSLTGRSVQCHVQDFLMLHQIFILHIPCISQQMYEMGFARRISAEMFQDFLLGSLQSKSGPTLPPERQMVVSLGTGERLHKREMFMYPELQAGTVETVVITEVTNPLRIFCQLKVFSQELKKLSEQLTQCCDGRIATCTIGQEMIGFPCAARGSDGKWYRSVLQQVFPVNKVVEVLNVDYGTKQIVQVNNVRPLASEFFRMPVVTYNCSLHGITDKGIGWTTSQLDYLRTLLLFKTIIAKFEYQSITEGVYYVTLYGDDNSNINDLFSSKESCLLQCEKTLDDYAIRPSGHNRNNTSVPLRRRGGMDINKMLNSQLVPVENLPNDSTHVAFVQYVASPSEFWIKTQNCAKELDELADKMANLFETDLKADVVKNPTVGLYCAAKAKDGMYYRAIVTEVGSAKVKVHFVDYGNSETVNNSCIRALREELKKLPQLALKCSLTDVSPKGREWSQEACELFTKMVLDKALNVHVVVKEDGCHFVHLTDPDAQGEKDLAKLLCSAGFAEKDETKRSSKSKTSSEFGLSSTAQYTRPSFQPQNALIRCNNNRKSATFKEQMFSIGSILDVNVSYIESPNDFWCQLVQSTGHLKLLMYDLQTHYRNSEFQPLVETACVARHPENGMWYRALIVHKHETPHVDVLFIDYGQTEMVSVFDLRRIEKDFQSLPGQAFRCSLFNPVDPTSAVNDWTEEAVDRFHSFVETAANGFVILKCTIYAVMYSEQKIVFNIVDLETPFESISTSLVNLVINAPLKRHSGPSFRLDTYYYSTHSVKTGTEEKVTVTSVKDVSHFYCQLKRNADILEDLQQKVASLCLQLQRVNVPPVFGTLCFAKYTDGHWYRGQIKTTKPSLLVHFVDYGDTLEVDKSDLLPIPKEASDIMAVPVQALLCSLSDIPDHIPPEANRWFETSSTECQFKALIVAREPDGKLVVELYQGNVQVNAKIKKLFELELHREDTVVCQESKPIELTVKPTLKMTNDSPTKEFLGLNDAISFVPRSSNPKTFVEKKMHPITKPRQNVKGLQQLYKPPHQRDFNDNATNVVPNCAEPPPLSKQKKYTLSIQANQNKTNIRQQPSIPASESWISDNLPTPKIEKLPKLADLPPGSITNGMFTEVYISHCNSPLSFYVQLVKEEENILSMVDKLNNPKTASKSADITNVYAGDLVCAEFADDSSWYRAVVKEKRDKATALVEFVDFGNTASVPFSKMCKLDKPFLQHPVYSTHCMLKGAAGLDKDKILQPEISSAFASAIGDIGERKLKCKFFQLSGAVWEVSLEDCGVDVECKIGMKRQHDNTLDSEVKKMPIVTKVTDSCSLRFKKQEFQEGQELKVYITTITDAHKFWCQSANLKELDQISENVAKAGNATDCKNLGPLLIGTPCIGLFPEDQFWYRAEVLDKTHDELFLFFVDYGNTSQVKLSDVKPIPFEMLQIPVQAFFCELEGFDPSQGSWETNAEDELSSLTADQLLQLTVTKVTKEDGKTKCYVHLECEGQVINESMRKFWKRNASNVLDTAKPSIKTHPFAAVKEAVLPVESKELESYDGCDIEVPCISQAESENVEELTEAEAGSTKCYSLLGEDLKYPPESIVEYEGQMSAVHAQVSSEKSLLSLVASLEEDDNQMCSTSSALPIPESLNISAITTEPSDTSCSDIALGETLTSCTGDESEDLSSSYEARLVDKDLEEQDLSVMDSTGTEDAGSPLDVCFLEARDVSSFTQPFDSPCKEVRHDLDICKYFDANQDPESRLVISESRPASVTTARLVPCLCLSPMGMINPEHETLEEERLMKNEDLFVVPSCALPQNSLDSDLDFETPDSVAVRTPPTVTSARMVPHLAVSPALKSSPDEIHDEPSMELPQNEDFALLSCDLSRDSFNTDQEAGPPEIIPEATCASSSGSMNEDSSTNDVASQDSDDLEQDAEVSEESPPANVTPLKMSKDEFLIVSNFDLRHNPLDSEQESKTTNMAVPETISTSSSKPKNEKVLLSPTSHVRDSFGLPQVGKSCEKVASTTTSACVTFVEKVKDQVHQIPNTGMSQHPLNWMYKLQSEALLMLPSSSITSKDSTDLYKDFRNLDVVIQESAAASVMPTEMDEGVLHVNVALPQDSFDLDEDTEAAKVVTSERMDQDALSQLTSDLLAPDSKKQEFDTVAAGDVLCQSRKDKSTSMKTDQASGLLTECQDLGSEVAAMESQEHAATCAEKCFFPQGEKTSLVNLCSGENLSDASRLRNVTEQETTDERPPSVEVPCGQLIELDDMETEAELYSFSSSTHFPEMTEMAEHMRCLVEEAVFAVEESSAESVSSDSLEDPLNSVEDSSEDTLTEDSESFFDHTLEAQLAKVTHLSVVIVDDSKVDNQSEE